MSDWRYSQPDPPLTTDVYHQVLTQSFSVVELNSVTVAPDLTCSFSGGTTILYTAGNFYPPKASSYVSIDLTSGILTVKAPSVESDTEIYFYVSSVEIGSSVLSRKLIKLTINNCQVENCIKCLSSSSSICEICSADSNLISGNCVIPNKASSESQGLRITTISVVITSFCMLTFLSFIDSSSMVSLWTTVNKVQLYFLLFLTRAFIPLNVQNVITGLKFSLSIGIYYNILSINLKDSAFGVFNFALSDQVFELLDIKSDSSIFNIIPIIILFLCMIPIHLLVSLIYKMTPTGESEGRCKWIKGKAVKLIKKLFVLLTFGWYIRYILETNQYILVSSLYEISKFDVSESNKIISLVFAILTLCLCLLLILFVLSLSLSSYEISKEKNNKLGEIFNGIEMKKKSKFYVSALLIRRALFVILLISLVSIKSWILVSLLSFMQLFYLILVVTLRPYERRKDNIIEISNEILFLALLSSLIFLNSEEHWGYNITEIYMWMIASNNIVTFLIIFIDLIRHLVLITHKGWSKSTAEEPKIVPEANSQINVMAPVQNYSSNNLSEIHSEINHREDDFTRSKRYINDERNSQTVRVENWR